MGLCSITNLGVNMLNQRQGVYVSTMNVLAEHGISFDDGQAGGAEAVVTKDIRAEIMNVVVAGFQAGEIEMSAEGQAKYSEEKKLRSYVSGLISNWFRKDLRLNGNAKHEVKNPGSRAGAGDEQLKALKMLRDAKADDAAAVTAINQAIEDRKSELKVTKIVTLTEEQLSKIPADLKAKLGL